MAQAEKISRPDLVCVGLPRSPSLARYSLCAQAMTTGNIGHQAPTTGAGTSPPCARDWGRAARWRRLAARIVAFGRVEFVRPLGADLGHEPIPIGVHVVLCAELQEDPGPSCGLRPVQDGQHAFRLPFFLLHGVELVAHASRWRTTGRFGV